MRDDYLLFDTGAELIQVAQERYSILQQISELKPVGRHCWQYLY